jgi:GT2 family glycosyltransferase
MEAAQGLVTVIVINWNGKEYLKDCFTSLERQTYSSLELIIVDNASGDGSVEYVREHFPKVKVIVNHENIGFGAAVNRGVAHAQGEYVLFLNNDLYLDERCVEKMVAMIRDETVGAVVPKILYFDERNRINSFGNLVNYLGIACPKYINEEEGEHQQVEETTCGGIFLIKKALFTQVGGFDPNFFIYHEDHDLSWRIRLGGKALMVNPEAVMYHKYHFGRNPQKYYYSEKNRLQLLLKNYCLKTLVLILPALVLVELAELCFALTTGWFILKLKSYLEIARLLPRILEKRRAIQRLRKVSDREITRLFVGTLRISGITHPLLDKCLSPILNSYWKLIKFGI